MKDSDLLKIKAAAVMEFANLIVGSFEAGFTKEKLLRVTDVYQVARNHCKDNYQSDEPNIVEAWGE